MYMYILYIPCDHHVTIMWPIILTHLFAPAGNAYFYGLSITEDLDAIRNELGVCPQHDVLWGDLTANEHMQMFGYLKGIPVQRMREEIATLLKEVQLNHVRKTLQLLIA